MRLSKTDFIQFLNCPESLWLLKNNPKKYPEGEFSLFLKKIIKEGYEVEEYSKELFPKGINIPENQDPEYTIVKLKSKEKTFFQPSFLSPKKAFARIDILEKLPNNSFHIYEVKSSTSIKRDKKHNHIKDACFQKYVLTECGHKVEKVSIIYLNKEYVKDGEINPKELLNIEDITEEVDAVYSQVVNEINASLNFIKKGSIDEGKCSCRLKTRTNHCDCFYYFNSDIPSNSIYEINRISSKKVIELVENNCTSMIDIPVTFDLNTNQKIQVESLKQGVPIINKVNIKKVLEKLVFPLHFVDYETYSSAVPLIDKLSPQKHIVFQVSVHKLQKDGELTHFEWLGNRMELPHQMLPLMIDFTKQKGTFISWNAPFEIARNKDMIKLIPEYSQFLNYMNEHMFDLMNIFKQDYIDSNFQGSISIKKVLPVLCPEINHTYKSLNVQDGTIALDTWGRMVLNSDPMINVKKTRDNLLAYCKLDTLAMVEIYLALKKIITS